MADRWASAPGNYSFRFFSPEQIDQILREGVKRGRTGSHGAIERILKHEPGVGRADLWRRIRQLQQAPNRKLYRRTAWSPEAGLLAIFASVALGLATIGIFGVVAYIVSQRTHEIGVRMALGAQKRDVFRLVLGRGIVLAATGTAVGLIGSFAVMRIVAGAVYSDSWLRGLLILGIAPAFVVLAALLASYVPARRATRVDLAGVTRHPNQEWMEQMARNVTMKILVF